MAKKESALAARMKKYEAVSKNFLTLGTPKVIRLDMRAGRTFCGNFEKPFDNVFAAAMTEAAKKICEQIPGSVFAYTQSDEISLVLNDMTEKGANCFFEGNVEKIVSISASICTLEFNKAYHRIIMGNSEISSEQAEVYLGNLWSGQFDSRAFMLPNVTEVHNYILWRQQDAVRNSIQMAGHAVFTDSELHKKNTSEINRMLLKKGIDWNNYPARHKRGIAITKELYKKDVVLPDGTKIEDVNRKRWIEYEMPELTKDPDFIRNVYGKKLLYDGIFVDPEQIGKE